MKNPTRFVPLNTIESLNVIYRYVMQEQMKLYKGKEDSKSTIAQAFKEASSYIKEIEDIIKAVNEESREDFIRLTEIYREGFERNFKFSPVYRYIKAYLYDNVNETGLSLFVRRSVNEILPETLTPNDIQFTKRSKEFTETRLNDFVNAELVDLIIDAKDIDQIRDTREIDVIIVDAETEVVVDVKDIMRVESEEARELQKEEIKNIEQRLEDNKKGILIDSKGEFIEPGLDPKILNMLDDPAFEDLDLIVQIEEDIKSVPYTVNTTSENVRFNKLYQVILRGEGLRYDYFKVRLKSRKFIKGTSKISLFDYLKENKRDTAPYEEAVSSFAYRVAWLVYQSKGVLSYEGYDRNDNVKKIHDAIVKMYKNKGTVDIIVKPETIKSQISASKKYNRRFQSEFQILIKAHLLKKGLNNDDNAVQSYINGLIAEKNGFKLFQHQSKSPLQHEIHIQLHNPKGVIISRNSVYFND
jgi:hypothetical protein